MMGLACEYEAVQQVAEQQPDEQPDEELCHPAPPDGRGPCERQYISYSTIPSSSPTRCSLTNFTLSPPDPDLSGADEPEP